MPLSPEIKKLAPQALKIKNSQVPLHRIIDVLATSDGDISKAIKRYRDINDADLRRALHFCAELLRAVEREAGLSPVWEAGLQGAPSGFQPAAAAASSSDQSKSAPAAAAPASDKPAKQKFSPDELRSFVDDSARGQVRVAKAYFDGASKGNPGDAGIGIAIFTMDGKKIAQKAEAIGTATNNIAEYTALIEAMKMARDLDIKVLNVIGDSELVVRQVSGVYKIKNPDILVKAKEVMELKRGFEKFSISYVGRGHNQLADALSTSLLKKKSTAKAGGGAAATFDGYRDFLGDVDPDADEGSTEV